MDTLWSGGHSEPRCGNVPLTRTPDDTPGTGLLPGMLQRRSILSIHEKRIACERRVDDDNEKESSQQTRTD